MARREARKRALEILYQMEITGQSLIECEDNVKKAGKEIPEFTSKIVKGTFEHKQSINEQINIAADRWTLERMPLLDRNILRMAIYEILFEEDVPVSVAINEAVELAKVYGTPDSSKFVNGVLGNVAKKIAKPKSK